MRRSLTVLLAFIAIRLAMPAALAAEALRTAATSGDPCLAQLRGGPSKWVECDAQFETDPAAQAELSRQTFDMLQNARCGGRIRVLRSALMSALITNGTLQLDPHEILCSVATSGGSKQQLTLTVAPKVSFSGGRIADVSPGLIGIANLPDLLVGPLRSAAESEFVRGQLTRGLNAYLENVLRK
jgi:hypothetical protein